MSGSQDFLTTQEFAEKAGVSAGTVSKWLRKEKIKGRKKGGKWMIDASEISRVSSQSPQKNEAAQQKRKPAATQSPKPVTGGKSYTIKEFSELTYLTEYGVEKWLKEGRLAAAADGSVEPRVDASNLELPAVKRLLR